MLMKDAENAENGENKKRLPFTKAFLHPCTVMNGKTL